MNKAQALRDIIAANGGRISGKTRLQKTVYFLEVAKVGAGFDFAYHYYGPYSEELSLAADDAEALQLLNVRREGLNSGLSYAVYETTKEVGTFTQSERRERILSTLRNYDVTALELAATSDFLSKNGFESASWAETRKRKSVKATDERMAKAKQLLDELNR